MKPFYSSVAETRGGLQENAKESYLPLLTEKQAEGASHMQLDPAGCNHDEDKLKRLNRLYSVSNAINMAILRISDVQRLYEQTCRIAVEKGGLLMAWVGLTEPERGRLKPVARWGKDDGYLDSIWLSVRTEAEGNGPAGKAFRSGAMAFTNDIAADTDSFVWWEKALERGYRACAAFPLKVEGNPIGIFAVYGDQSGYFDTEELQLLDTLANNLSFAVESQQKEERHQRAVNALRASEANMAAAQRIAHFGSWELDLFHQEEVNVNRLRWSEEMFRIAGFQPGEVEVTNALFFQLAHPDDHEMIHSALADAIARRVPYSVVHRLIRPNGEERIVHETAQLFYDRPYGRPLKMIGTAHDITEQMRAQKAVEESEERFRATFEQAAVGIAHVAPDGRLLRVNDKLCAILGRSRDELLEREFAHFMVAEDFTGENRTPLSMFLDTEDSSSTEQRYRHKNGEAFWANVVTTLVREPSGQPKYFISVIKDITQRKMAELRLQRLNRLYAVLSRIGESIIRIRDPHTLFQSACQIIVENGLLPMALIARFEGDGAVGVLAISGAPKSFLDEPAMIEGFWEQGPAAVASRKGSYDVKNNLTTDSASQSLWKEAALKNGFQAIASFPIHTDNASDNALVLFASETDYFQEDEIRLMVAVVSDLSFALETMRKEQKRLAAEEALRVSENRYRNLVETSHDLIWAVDGTGKITFLNQAARRIFGRAPEQMIGRHLTDFIQPEQYKKDEALFTHAIAQGLDSLDFESCIEHQDGHLAILNASANLVRREDGEIVAITGMARDVTESRRAEQALRESEKRFRAVYEQAAIGICVISLEGRFLRVNRRFCEIVGYSCEELLASTYIDSTHPDDKSSDMDAVRRLMEGETSVSIEKRYLKKNHTVVWCNLTLSLLREAPHDSEFFIGMIEDITARRRSEAELARANRALQMLSRCNEALIRAENEKMLLAAICQIAFEMGGFHMAWVGYAMQDEEKTVQPQAWAGVENGYLSTIRVTWAEESPAGRGPVGRAIRSGRPVAIADVGADHTFRPWLNSAHARGYRGIICLPLRDSLRTFGVLVLYLSEVRDLQPDELDLLQELTDDLAFGIVTLRSRAEQRRIHEAVLAMARGVSTSTGAEFFEKLTFSMVEALGAYAGFLAQLNSPDFTTARTLCSVVNGKVTPNYDYPLAGTPCEHLAQARVWVIPANARRAYPEACVLEGMGIEAYVGTLLLDEDGEPIGMMFVLFQQPLVQQEFVLSTLKIFASRAASELGRQKADAKMREQASFLDKAQDAILVRDLDHRITYWNKSAERLYGWSNEEMLGRSAQEFLYNDTLVFSEATEKLFKHGDWVGELSQTSKDGRSLIVESRWTLVRDDAGHPRSVLAINTDITERRMLERQFLRAQRMESIGTLAGGIAHDLNNILTPIMMAVGMLKRGEVDPKRAGILSTIEMSAERGADMVRQVLSFARGVEGRRLTVQIKHLLRDIEKITNDTFLKHIQIRTVIPYDLWTVTGDPTQLHQVLLNLCVNARDAMPYGGALTISAENLDLDAHYAGLNIDAKPGPYVLIRVEDSGIGIPAQVIDQIFDPFFTTKELGMGTGLGLSTSLAIIKSHGGFIRVDSEPGKGTRFSVYLPAKWETTAEVTTATPCELPRGRGELILVVDDEPAVREITQQTLEAFGYRVVLASDGAEAVATYASLGTEITAVLTDMMMPVLDGPSTIQVLLKLNPKLPFIAASGFSASGHVARATNLGVKHFLPKPYTAETLLKLLSEICHEQAQA
ncbi:MAG: PAS domain S-box protein [Verrucomicrobiota bacterium]